jgi:serine/threonine protein kinase
LSANIGSKLGFYEITALLGKGGMGEVYRARDTKLKRDVAIKILPAEFARDPDRVSRFQREAEMLASLNHPHSDRGGVFTVSNAQSERGESGRTHRHGRLYVARTGTRSQCRSSQRYFFDGLHPL